MRFRKVLFWLHLASGCVAGIVILIMSVTGTLLMYEKQMIAWADREYRVAAPA
ncbi:MAG: PepSY domain-containing protein, partial [Bryobacteraceae bacterium]|nr:PepSY domain-containing protein [Bryobacteraceae bacterium]